MLKIIGHFMAMIVICSSAVWAQKNGVSAGPVNPLSPGGAVNSTNSTRHARGPFEVKLTPQKPDNKEAESAKLGRISLAKQFHGELEGTSAGEMLYAGDATTSGGYVALERVTGALGGRTGSFVLQHSGTMNRGQPQLSITVVPDSGTGELQGLTGQMNITQTDGKHFYDFDYTLPASAH